MEWSWPAQACETACVCVAGGRAEVELPKPRRLRVPDAGRGAREFAACCFCIDLTTAMLVFSLLE